MLKLFTFALAAVLFVSTGGLLAQTPSTATIRLVAAPDDDFTPILYAQHAGLFEKAGLSVDVQRVSGGALATNAVIGGAADIGMSDVVRLIIAHAHQIPIFLFAPSGLYLPSSPQSGIIVLKNSPIHTARDLNGKSVAVPGLGGVSYMGTRAWSDRNGGDSTSLHFVEIPPPLVSAALDSGRIDAGTITNPSFATAMASGKYRLIGDYVLAMARRSLQTGWFTTPTYAAQHRLTLQTFIRVLKQASDYTNGHHDETVDLVAASTGINPATIRQMNRGVAGTVLSASDIQPLIDVAAQYKLIDKSFPAQEMFLR